MKNSDFNIEVENACNRSKRVLQRKGEEYGADSDRLINFKRSAAIQSLNSIETAVGFMTKHYDSVCQMAKNPSSFNRRVWNEKLGDLRNYTILIEGLLTDLGIEL